MPLSLDVSFAFLKGEHTVVALVLVPAAVAHLVRGVAPPIPHLMRGVPLDMPDIHRSTPGCVVPDESNHLFFQLMGLRLVDVHLRLQGSEVHLRHHTHVSRLYDGAERLLGTLARELLDKLSDGVQQVERLTDAVRVAMAVAPWTFRP